MLCSNVDLSTEQEMSSSSSRKSSADVVNPVLGHVSIGLERATFSGPIITPGPGPGRPKNDELHHRNVKLSKENATVRQFFRLIDAQTENATSHSFNIQLRRENARLRYRLQHNAADETQSLQVAKTKPPKGIATVQFPANVSPRSVHFIGKLTIRDPSFTEA